MAAVHDTTAGDVALEWLMQQEGVLALPRSSNPRRIAANLRRSNILLSPEELAAIAALHRSGGRVFPPSWAPDWNE
ncbi:MULTISPECIES: aldo/keto reductase [unclassified Bradyrhizobium]|uniref:aldo/keto reductase n=1 Tax=unclassified Bradyrhizobium TaxID=2631580 RepID=UPI00339255F1